MKCVVLAGIGVCSAFSELREARGLEAELEEAKRTRAKHKRRLGIL